MAGSTNNSTPCLLLADVRAMLRLGNTLHRASSDPVMRKRILLDGLCRLVGADSARSVVTKLDRATARRIVISVVHAGAASPDPPAGGAGAPTVEAGSQRRPDPDASDPPAPAARAAPAPPRDAGHSLDSFVDLYGMQVVASLTVNRHYSGLRFTHRDRKIVDLMHSEMSWIYDLDVLLVSPEVMSLPPRQRQTLQHLLVGDGERQIAVKLGLSSNTVHHYVKALYRHFGVSSRGELLSRPARGTNPFRAPP